MMSINTFKSNLFLYKYVCLALMASAIIIFAIGRLSNIDLMIEDYYYDAQLHQFLWKNTWFAKDFMHGYVKDAIIFIGVLLLLATLLDAIFSWQRITPLLRVQLRFVAAAAVLIPTLISGLKQFTIYHCPWDVDRYGGAAPFVRFLDAVPSAMEAGHCFPAGHASTGLWLAAFCVFYLPNKPKVALAVFFAGLSVGLALGWVQQMRGAHFLFHTLWSAWLASLVITFMLLCFKIESNNKIK